MLDIARGLAGTEIVDILAQVDNADRCLMRALRLNDAGRGFFAARA